MIDKLIELSDKLDQKGLHSAANSVDNIIKKALMGPDPRKIEQMKRQSGPEQMHALLDVLGLVPIIGEGADLANAALYLSQGLTPYNLLMAGLSVTSMVPTLGDVSKVIKYGGKLAPEIAAKIAGIMLRHQGKIKAAFDKFKDIKAAKYVQSYVKNGDLLTKYSDQMWNAVRDWFYKVLDGEAKKRVQEKITQKSPDQTPENQRDLEDWAMGQLPTL